GGTIGPSRSGTRFSLAPGPICRNNRGRLSGPERAPMIRFSCPRCKTILESPDDSAGTAMTCPCGQRLEVPAPRVKALPGAARPTQREDNPPPADASEPAALEPYAS